MIEKWVARTILICLLLAGAVGASVPARAQERVSSSKAIQERYAKQEYRIAMRDGAHLFTAVYTPKDMSRKYPILMMRTPYSVGPYEKDRYPFSLGPNRDFD